MRGQFNVPSHSHYLTLLGNKSTSRRGGALQDIRIFSPHRRGGGLFSMFKGLAKRALPFFMENVFPHVVSGGSSVLQDMAKGKKFKRVARERGMETLNAVSKKIRGGGVKRKAPCSGHSKKKYKKDVFDGF